MIVGMPVFLLVFGFFTIDVTLQDRVTRDEETSAKPLFETRPPSPLASETNNYLPTSTIRYHTIQKDQRDHTIVSGEDQQEDHNVVSDEDQQDYNAVSDKDSQQQSRLWDKTHFDWLHSQEYRDTNDWFANGDKYLDMNYLFGHGKDNNILLQRIISEHASDKNRNKRSTSRNKHKQRENKNKNYSHSKRHTPLKISKYPIKSFESNADDSPRNNKINKNRDVDIDLKAMDKMIMAMTLSRLTHDTDFDDDTNEIQPKSNRHRRSFGAIKPTSYYIDEVEKKESVSHRQNLEAYKDVMIDLYQTLVNNLLLTPKNVSGQIVINNKTFDLLGHDRSIQNKMYEAPKGEGYYKRNSHSMQKRETSLSDEENQKLKSKPISHNQTEARAKDFIYFKNVLEKLRKVLARNMATKGSKSDNETEIDLNRTIGHIQGISKRVLYKVIDNGLQPENHSLNFVSLDNQTNGKNIQTENSTDIITNKMITLDKNKRNHTKTKSDPAKIRPKKENLKAKQENNTKKPEKQKQKTAKQETLQSKQNAKTISNKPKIESKPQDSVPETLSRADHSIRCKRIHQIFNMLQDFMAIAIKVENNVNFNSLSLDILKTAMAQIAEIMDVDILRSIEKELVRCLDIQDESILPMVTTVTSSFLKQTSPGSSTTGNEKTSVLALKQKDRKMREPVSNSRNLSRFSTLQNIVNYKFMGQKTQKIFRDKFESISPFSQQQNNQPQLLYYTVGPYCSQILNKYLSSSDLQKTLQMSDQYQRPNPMSQCSKLCQIEAKFKENRKNLGIVEGLCVKRLIETIRSCDCEELLNDQQTDLLTEAIKDQQGEDVLYNDDPNPIFNTASLARSREVLYGRGKPIPSMRPPRYFPGLLRPKVTYNENTNVLPNTKAKEIQTISYSPNSMRTPNRISALVNRGENTPRRYFLNNIKSEKNIIPFQRNPVQNEPNFGYNFQNPRKMPTPNIAISPNGKTGITTNMGAPRPMMYSPTSNNGKSTGKQQQMPLFTPAITFTNTRKETADPTFQFYNPLVILVTAPIK